MKRDTSYLGLEFALIIKQEQTLLATLGMIKAILASDNPTEKINEFTKKLTRWDRWADAETADEKEAGIEARQSAVEFFISQLLVDDKQTEK
jgi:hypothetical protein